MFTLNINGNLFLLGTCSQFLFVCLDGKFRVLRFFAFVGGSVLGMLR